MDREGKGNDEEIYGDERNRGLIYKEGGKGERFYGWSDKIFNGKWKEDYKIMRGEGKWKRNVWKRGWDFEWRIKKEYLKNLKKEKKGIDKGFGDEVDKEEIGKG